MKKVSFLGLIYSLVFLTSLYQNKEFTDPFMVPKHYFLMYTTLIGIVSLLVYYFTKKLKLNYSITTLDTAIFAFAGFVAVQVLVRGQITLASIPTLNLFLLVVFYAMFRPIFSRDLLKEQNGKFLNTAIWVIIILGILQASYGLGQYFGFIKSLQKEFKIATAFGNPGPYANFLMVILPFTLAHALSPNKGSMKNIAILSSALILIVLPFTAARTAFIAAVVVIAYLVLHLPIAIKIKEKYFSSLRNKILLAVVVVGIGIGGIYGLTSFKQQSASGRLFIWKVSLEMIKDKPIFGHGYTMFPPAHNDYQADYFRENPNDWDNAFLADGVNYAFNEYIQYGTEIGIVGLLLFLLIAFFVYRKKIIKPITKESAPLIAAEASVAVLLVSSLFSYPLQSVPVLTIFFFSLAIVSSKQSKTIYTFALQPTARKVAVVAGLILCIFFYRMVSTRSEAEKDWLKAFHLVRQGKYDMALRVYPELYKNLRYSQFFLFNYGAELSVMNQHAQSIEILKEVEHRLNDADFYIYIGNSYEGTGQVEKAIESFEKASFIMPIKYYPRYRLVQLYRQRGEIDKAVSLAKYILKMPVKVESELVTNMRKEMRAFLQQTDPSYNSYQ